MWPGRRCWTRSSATRTPLFAGSRHAEYAERLGGASLAEVAGPWRLIWSSVGIDPGSRGRPHSRLSIVVFLRPHRARRRGRGGGKSGYGLAEVEQELRQLELLRRSREATPMGLVISFLGAHVVPAAADTTLTPTRCWRCFEQVIKQGIAEFHDITVRARAVHACTGAEGCSTIPRAGHCHRGAGRHVGQLGGAAGKNHHAGRGGSADGSDLHARRGDTARVGETDTIAVPAAPGRAPCT